MRGEKQNLTAEAPSPQSVAEVCFFKKRTPCLCGALVALFLSRSAIAAGVGIPDLGAAALGQAGATVARPADLTALYYNPGALGFLEGIQAYVDVRLVDQRVTFQRLDSL